MNIALPPKQQGIVVSKPMVQAPYHYNGRRELRGSAWRFHLAECEALRVRTYQDS